MTDGALTDDAMTEGAPAGRRRLPGIDPVAYAHPRYWSAFILIGVP